jgi:hypothetical protein
LPEGRFRLRGEEAARSEPLMITALRVPSPWWLEDDHLERLFAWLATAPRTFDELALFTSETHPPLPLHLMVARAERLKAVLPQARRLGYGAGINLLAVIGHHAENLPNSLDEPWQRLTGPDGDDSPGCYCPEDPGFQGYVRAVITALAQAAPDFLWIDDDVRLMGHGPVNASCFCARCLARFAQEVGRAFTRESLVAATAGEATPERMSLRRAWLEHNRGVIARLLALIEEAAHAERPGLMLGFMTGDRFYEGYAFARWAATLAGPNKTTVRWRPGAGFYSDETLIGLVGKAHEVGRQASALPETVTIIQSELENFPDHLLRKSAATTVLESAAHMAAGATGAAFNFISPDPSNLEEMRPILARASACRPFFERLHAELGRSPALGVWPAWNGDLFAGNGEPDSWFRRGRRFDDLRAPYALGELGLPVCYDGSGATVVALAGETPRVFAREDLEAMLRGGVLLDATALQLLWDLGLGEAAGVRPGASFAVDTLEVLDGHALNGFDAGSERDCRQSFWRQEARVLEPCAPGVEMLSHLADYNRNNVGPCLSIFENPQGGRVAVAGYYPWTMITTAAKVRQYRALARWLSRDRLPAVVETLAKVVVWVRAGAHGRRAAIVLNASLDPQPALAVQLLMPPGRVEHVPMDGTAKWLDTEPASPGYRRVIIPHVAPWSLHLVLYEAGAPAR